MHGILFNSDGGAGALYHFEPPISPEQLCNVVNQLVGTQVSVFIQSVNHGNDQFLYDTKVAQVYDGRHVPGGKFEQDNFRKWALNVRSLLDRDLDPLALWAERTHELGMQFWPSMRMNDIHNDWVDRRPSIRSEWQKQNPHLMIGEDVPDVYVKCYEHRFSWAMDFAHEQVRRRKFALIDEMCAERDVDGFEMDFLSHPMYFRNGHEQEGMPLLNDFMRRVRSRLDEIGRHKGRKLTLLARVGPTFSECEQVGMDVRTWIREGLVDVLQPMSRSCLDMNADVAGFVEAAQGTAVEVAGGIEYYVQDYGGGKITRASIEMMRGAAASFWRQGAGSIYLFNFDCHALNRFHPMAPIERQMLEQIGSPQTLCAKDKHYFITRDAQGLSPDAGGQMPLPVNLTEPGVAKLLTFNVGDDLDAARRAGTLRSVTLALTFNAPPAGRVAVTLNGRRLPESEPTTHLHFSTLTCSDAPVVAGRNDLRVTLTQHGGLYLEGVEIRINYR
ncbi:MAG: hypothetical protein CMJ18_22030 [Phycisphaeraceae bacterium]|nr:hypothetical protein [Phycisphaeraceae bacterium]